MVFEAKKFTTLGAQTKGGSAFQLFGYLADTDSLTTIATAGYFNLTRQSLRVNDIIRILNNTVTPATMTEYKVTSIPLNGNVVIEEALGYYMERKTILCWSGGKDSTATGILAKLHGIHIDEIVTVMPDPFKDELKLKDKFSDFMELPINVLESFTFEDYFNRIKVRGKYKGTIYGWPFTAYKTCARILKWEPMQKYFKDQEVIFLLGIAKNENRKILEPNRSLLVEYNLTENDALELCKKYDLLNPLYQKFKRLGCVRCPKQGLKALQTVRELEPEKYQWCLNNDDRSPVKFKPNKTFKEIHEIIKNQ